MAIGYMWPRVAPLYSSLSLLGRIAVLHKYGLLLQTVLRGLSVGRSVCLSITIVRPAKRLNRSRCRLRCGLGWGKEPLLDGVKMPHANEPFFLGGGE